jgi:hypothetical protein
VLSSISYSTGYGYHVTTLRVVIVSHSGRNSAYECLASGSSKRSYFRQTGNNGKRGYKRLKLVVPEPKGSSTITRKLVPVGLLLKTSAPWMTSWALTVRSSLQTILQLQRLPLTRCFASFLTACCREPTQDPSIRRKPIRRPLLMIVEWIYWTDVSFKQVLSLAK